ncbi:MAG: DUF3224 domain-containing protein [Dyella sp.]
MTMTVHASGSFEVKLAALDPADEAGGVTLGRMSLDKQFLGDLQGSGKGQMLSALSAVAGSGAYVALERVSGALKGRRGSFVLQHSGSMADGQQHMTITVVPDSGSDELTGLSGTFNIRIVDGKHCYDFDYQLPEPS